MGDFDLQGLEAAIATMKALPNDVRKKCVQQAAGKAMRIVTKAAKANAQRVDDPETGRKIAKNISQRFASRYYRNTGDVMIRVGVATPKGRIPTGNPDEGDGGPTPHWHLVELGTSTAKAEPFMLPALANNVDSVTTTFGNELSRRIDKVTST